MEINRGPATSFLTSTLSSAAPQACGELARVVIGPEMHEEDARLFVEHVAVQGGDLDAVGLQGLDHRIDLLASSTKSPVMAAVSKPVGWKLMAIAAPIGARQGHALVGDRLGARNAELVDAAAILAEVSHDAVDADHVDVGRVSTCRAAARTASC